MSDLGLTINVDNTEQTNRGIIKKVSTFFMDTAMKKNVNYTMNYTTIAFSKDTVHAVVPYEDINSSY